MIRGNADEAVVFLAVEPIVTFFSLWIGLGVSLLVETEIKVDLIG